MAAERERLAEPTPAAMIAGPPAAAAAATPSRVTAAWDGGKEPQASAAPPLGAELERSLRRALKAQRDAEVRLQLELQKKVRSEGAAGRLLRERELLQAQVEDIRGRLLEAKLQNVKLKTELRSRAERSAGGAASCRGACASCRARCRRRREGRSRDGKELCVVVVVLAVAVAGMLAYFATTSML